MVEDKIYSNSFKYTPVASPKTIKCENCSYVMLIHNEEHPPEICAKCGRDPRTGEIVDPQKLFHNEHADDSVKPTTHVQIRWSCLCCSHSGVAWQKKNFKYGTFACPNCDSKKHVSIRKLPKEGRMKPLWSTPDLVQSKKFRGFNFSCPHCSHTATTFVRWTICPVCKTKLTQGYQEQSE